MTLTKVSNANVYMYNFISPSKYLKMFLKTQGLHCHELIFCKWVNLQKPRY